LSLFELRKFSAACINPNALKDDSPMDEEAFFFGAFRLLPAQRMLLEDGKPVHLGSRALDVLVALVQRAGDTLHKDQLIACAWPDTVVDEGALRVNVAALRRALGDGRGGNRFIANIPGRGYSFVAPVGREQGQETAAPPNRSALGGNLPAQLTRVIGRSGIVATVVARVAQQRFLTIVGPGGIGKTTVAVAAAEALSGSYSDGVWFVGLGSLQDPALVPSAVGAVLGSPPGLGDPLSSLVASLRDKCALIVIEHVVGAAAATAEAMLKAAPQVAILATSREPLRAEGEWLLRLPSLEVPPERSGLTAAEALSFPAVELFNERAVATLDGFDLTDADIPIALEICRRLDGVPLAIELATAQVDVFGIKGLAAHLDDRLAVLTRGRRTAVPR
jgi:DNA-binding winged helix-turn-helix (wHTH) protein